MSIHLQRQFDRLKKSILTLGALVEESLERSIRAAQSRDTDLAQQVIEDDSRIDLMETDIEEECCHTLALHQPVAFDLRFVVATLKINSDLERIADLASNIAEQTLMLADLPRLDQPPVDVPAMSLIVRRMLKKSLDALVNVDPQLAQQVINAELEVDEIHRQTYVRVADRVAQQPDRVSAILHYLSISRQLERIGDHCVSIAEDVLYMAQGQITRHR